MPRKLQLQNGQYFDVDLNVPFRGRVSHDIDVDDTFEIFFQKNKVTMMKIVEKRTDADSGVVIISSMGVVS